MNHFTRVASIVVLLAGCASALAQAPGYTGPATPRPGYTGPSAVPVMTAKQLLDSGKDDQYVTLRGKLIRHTGGKHYDFADQSGQIRVEISEKHFPPNVAIDANTEVELTGEFDKERFGTSELEVKQLRLVTK